MELEYKNSLTLQISKLMISLLSDLAIPLAYKFRINPVSVKTLMDLSPLKRSFLEMTIPVTLLYCFILLNYTKVFVIFCDEDGAQRRN